MVVVKNNKLNIYIVILNIFLKFSVQNLKVKGHHLKNPFYLNPNAETR